MQHFGVCKKWAFGIPMPLLALLNNKYRQAVMIMKITAFILLVCFLQVSAKSPAQEKITIKEKGASLVKIFTQINKQTGYNFFFTNEDLRDAKPVDIQVKNASLKEVLDLLFKKQNLTYIISDKIITIVSKKNDEPVKAESVLPLPIDIRGKVVDENGKTIPGVTVTIRGTKKQTITDDKGEFHIADVPSNAVVAFSSVNMEPYEIRVSGQSEIVAVLKTKSNQLDEVQIIGYGQTTKRLQTGNVSSIKSVDIEKQPVNNPLLALQGRVPGLFITQNTGVPGGGVTVRIQGQNSIRNGNDPLYIVDGVPYILQLPTTANGLGSILGNSGGQTDGLATGVGNPLNYLNVSDIESIEVLRDADATAIYGSRAANGAILITTKKGKTGKAKIDLNAQAGFGNVAHKMKMLDTRQYLDMRYRAFKNDGKDWRSPSVSANDLKFWDTTRYTDWQDKLIGHTAEYQKFNCGISGGNPDLQYLVNGNYSRETTVFPGSFSDEKAGVHISLNTGVLQKFQFSLSASYMIDNNRLPVSDLTKSAVLFEPNAPSLFTPEGLLNWQTNASGTSTFTNPLAEMMNSYHNKTNNLIGNTILGYKITPNLEIKTSLGYNVIQTDEFAGFPLVAVRPENQATTQRTAQFSFRTINSWIAEPQIVYKILILGGRLETLFGSTFQQNNALGNEVNGIGYYSDNQLKSLQSATTITTSGSFDSKYKYNAFFGRLNYNFGDKYILNLTARRDGSSRFGNENRFNNFGSVGGAWILSKMNFFKRRLPAISFAKIRVSIGATGNDQIGDYAYLNLYSPIGIGYLSPYQNSISTAPDFLNNPYIHWEETRKLSVGLDLGVFNDRVIFNASFNQNRSSNQLLPFNLPSITGGTSVTTNFPAKVQNISWEFSLHADLVKMKNTSWLINLNLTVPKNKLISFPNLESSAYANTLVINQPISIKKVYQFAGVDPTTGLYTFRLNDGTVGSTPSFTKDRTALINTLPKIYGGMQSSFTYRRISLDFLLQFVKQTASIEYLYYGDQPPGYFLRGLSNQPVSVLDTWEKAGDQATIQKYSTVNRTATLVKSSTAGYSDASYIRLKNLDISWQVPDIGNKGRYLRNLRLYVQGQNLFTITNYKGLDPETQSVSSLPPLRVITFGTRIGL